MDIREETARLLEELGVLGVSQDDFILDFSVKHAEEIILTDINHKEMPEGLRYTFVCMAAGFYLQNMKSAGRLQLESVDLADTPAKQIKEGDVQVTFAAASDGSLTPEARLDALIRKLTWPDPSTLTRYRRLSC